VYDGKEDTIIGKFQEMEERDKILKKKREEGQSKVA